MSDKEFSEQIVIVTGVSSGLGESIARGFAAEGAKVVVHYRSNRGAADDVVNKIKADDGEAIALAAALDNEDAVKQFFAEVEQQFGIANILINNAGSFPNSTILDMTLEQWRQIYANNVESTFLCTKEAALAMKRNGGGVIINISSIAAINPGPDHAHYNSAKAAVSMFTTSAAQEFGPDNIRVNAVAPGVVYRDGIEDNWPDGVNRFIEASPLSCLVQAQDITNACIFLASDKAARITGATLPVDSGVLAAKIY